MTFTVFFRWAGPMIFLWCRFQNTYCTDCTIYCMWCGQIIIPIDLFNCESITDYLHFSNWEYSDKRRLHIYSKKNCIHCTVYIFLSLSRLCTVYILNLLSGEYSKIIMLSRVAINLQCDVQKCTRTQCTSSVLITCSLRMNTRKHFRSHKYVVYMTNMSYRHAAARSVNTFEIWIVAFLVFDIRVALAGAVLHEQLAVLLAVLHVRQLFQAAGAPRVRVAVRAAPDAVRPPVRASLRTARRPLVPPVVCQLRRRAPRQR